MYNPNQTLLPLLPYLDEGITEVDTLPLLTNQVLSELIGERAIFRSKVGELFPVSIK